LHFGFFESQIPFDAKSQNIIGIFEKQRNEKRTIKTEMNSFRL
jgi:hypothetical protein